MKCYISDVPFYIWSPYAKRGCLPAVEMCGLKPWQTFPYCEPGVVFAQMKAWCVSTGTGCMCEYHKAENAPICLLSMPMYCILLPYNALYMYWCHFFRSAVFTLHCLFSVYKLLSVCLSVPFPSCLILSLYLIIFHIIFHIRHSYTLLFLPRHCLYHLIPILIFL